MAKRLEKKTIEGIVNSQVNLIRKRDCNSILNYSLLKEYLEEGIETYLKEVNASDKEIDLNLIRKIEKDMKSEVSTRLINSARDYFKIEYPKNPTENQLLELYNTAESDLSKNGNYFGIKNYGHGTHKLLETYLKFKSLIKEE